MNNHHHHIVGVWDNQGMLVDTVFSQKPLFSMGAGHDSEFRIARLEDLNLVFDFDADKVLLRYWRAGGREKQVKPRFGKPFQLENLTLCCLRSNTELPNTSPV